MKLILAYFGYVNITKDVVMLSIGQENFFRRMIQNTIGGPLNDSFKVHLEGQRTLTKFLRSGRKFGK